MGKTNQTKLIGALALARKAGKLKAGFDAAAAALERGADLALFSSDIAERTRRNTLLIREGVAVLDLPFTQHELEQSIGKRFVVAAVSDSHFSELIRRAAKEESL